jgi:hypothetical protein
MRWWWDPLYTRPTRFVYTFIVLAHWNNSLRINMFSHPDIFSWFQANQSLLFLLNAGCLGEKQYISAYFIVFGLTRPGLEPRIYQTWDNANHYTTDEPRIYQTWDNANHYTTDEPRIYHTWDNANNYTTDVVHMSLIKLIITSTLLVRIEKFYIHHIIKF